MHIEAREHAGGLVFLYGVRAGPARQSYGLEVARLASVPERIIERAHRYLQELEAGHHSPAAQADLFTAPPSALPAPDPLRERLADIDPRHAPPTRSSTNCCNT